MENRIDKTKEHDMEIGCVFSGIWLYGNSDGFLITAIPLILGNP